MQSPDCLLNLEIRVQSQDSEKSRNFTNSQIAWNIYMYMDVW